MKAASRQLLRAMKADPVFCRMVLDCLTKQEARKPKGPDDLRRRVLEIQRKRLLTESK